MVQMSEAEIARLKKLAEAPVGKYREGLQTTTDRQPKLRGTLKKQKSMKPLRFDAAPIHKGGSD